MSVFVTDNALLSVLLLLGKPGAQLSTGGIDVFAHFPADGGIDFMFLQYLLKMLQPLFLMGVQSLFLALDWPESN